MLWHNFTWSVVNDRVSVVGHVETHKRFGFRNIGLKRSYSLVV